MSYICTESSLFELQREKQEPVVCSGGKGNHGVLFFLDVENILLHTLKLSLSPNVPTSPCTMGGRYGGSIVPLWPHLTLP
jgi:hypothetical protein